MTRGSGQQVDMTILFAELFGPDGEAADTVHDEPSGTAAPGVEGLFHYKNILSTAEQVCRVCCDLP